MKILIFVSALLIASVMLISCKKDNPIPPGEQPQMNLTLEDITCTEAWLNLKTANLALPAEVEILRDSVLAKTINLISGDTVLYIDSLLPNKTYIFKSILQSGIHPIESSVSVSTLDTTSHDFTWQTFTFGGQAGSCVLNDVAIVNDTCIYAVGEIYLLDSIGQADLQAYGMAKWNGQTWDIKKLFYNNDIPITPRGILIINPNDIYLASGSIFHWDGISSTAQLVYSRLNLPNPDETIEKLWGNSEKLLGVGNAGTIVSFQNGHWSKIESGTDLNINDIWGHTYDSGEQFILCAASNFGTNDQKKLLKINNNNADTINWTPQRTLFTIWFQNANKIYAGGSGVYSNAGYIWNEEKSLPHNFTFRIRGNNYNDVYATGGLGYFAHFNGYSWNILSSIALQGGDYESLDTKGNTTCVVGYIGAKAVVTIINK